jgi:hypothetical protein
LSRTSTDLSPGKGFIKGNYNVVSGQLFETRMSSDFDKYQLGDQELDEELSGDRSFDHIRSNISIHCYLKEGTLSCDALLAKEEKAATHEEAIGDLLAYRRLPEEGGYEAPSSTTSPSTSSEPMPPRGKLRLKWFTWRDSVCGRMHTSTAPSKHVVWEEFALVKSRLRERVNIFRKGIAVLICV